MFVDGDEWMAGIRNGGQIINANDVSTACCWTSIVDSLGVLDELALVDDTYQSLR